MGPTSQFCQGSIKKSKRNASSPVKAALSKQKQIMRKQRQTKLQCFVLSDNTNAKDNEKSRTEQLKKKCDMAKKGYRCPKCDSADPSKSHKGHHPQCPKHKHCGKSEDQIRNVDNELRIKRLNHPLKPTEKGHVIPHQRNINSFFGIDDSPMRCRSSLTESFSPPKITVDKRKLMSHETLSVSAIQAGMKSYLKSPTTAMKKCSKAIPQVTAAVEYIMSMLPNKTKKTTSLFNPGDKSSIGHWQWEAYQKLFPPGTLGFTFPLADKSKPPNSDCALIEGKTAHILRWEMNVPGLELKCPLCQDRLTHGQCDFSKHGTLTPVQDMSGVVSCAVSMQCECVNPSCRGCGKDCHPDRTNNIKANNGQLLASIPSQFRQGYPVEPRHAVGDIHITKTASRMLHHLMLTTGNGNQISRMFCELQAMRHEDLCEEMAQQALSAKSTIEEAPPSFYNCNCNRFLNGDQLRDRYDDAASSDLTATGVSDHDRCTREIQSVGCSKVAAADHTFATIKNYQSKDIDGAKCVFTVDTGDTGEIGGAWVVDSTEGSQYAHALEQFAFRPNVNPSVFVTDNWPVGKDLINCIFKPHTSKPVKGRLGLFHYVQRLTKTINDRHPEYRSCQRELSNSIWFQNAGDVGKVRAALADGRLNGKKYGFDELDDLEKSSQWSNYRKYIRIETRQVTEIHCRLEKWFEKYKDVPRCEKSQLNLFTSLTKQAYVLALRNAQYVTDVLDLDQLYTAVSKTKAGLTVWAGARGAESKLESFHLQLSHFANRGSRRSLVDNLSLQGIATYNRRIRWRMKSLRDNSVVPSVFQRSPPNLNHHYLEHINRLFRKAGLRGRPLFLDVEHLERDNGERFMSEYWAQQKDRNAKRDHGIIKKNVHGRCLCLLCGGRNNPLLNTPFLAHRNEVRKKERLARESAPSEPKRKPRKKHPPSPLKTKTGHLLLQPNPVTQPSASYPATSLTMPWCVPATNSQFNEVLALQQFQSQQQLLAGTMPFVPPIYPPTYPNTLPMPVLPPFCCSKAAEWHAFPKITACPHDKNCPTKQTTIGAMAIGAIKWL